MSCLWVGCHLPRLNTHPHAFKFLLLLLPLVALAALLQVMALARCSLALLVPERDPCTSSYIKQLLTAVWGLADVARNAFGSTHSLQGSLHESSVCGGHAGKAAVHVTITAVR